MELNVEPIARVATAIRHDLDKVGKVEGKFAELLKLSVGDHQFLVDYNASQFKLNDRAWKGFVLPYKTSTEDLQARLTDHLLQTSREVGEGKRDRDILFRGSTLALEAFAHRLADEGPLGSLAALSIDDIMARAVDHAVKDAQEELENNPTLWRTLLDAWHGLLRLVVDIVYGKEYAVNLRRDRWHSKMPQVTVAGILVGIAVAIVL